MRAPGHHFIGCRCHCHHHCNQPRLTKMINFITVYFKLASKAFHIYSTSIIIYYFHPSSISPIFHFPSSISAVGTTSQSHRFLGTFGHAVLWIRSVKVRENLNFNFFRTASATAMATIQKVAYAVRIPPFSSRTIDLAQSILVWNCFLQWKQPQRTTQFIRHNTCTLHQHIIILDTYGMYYAGAHLVAAANCELGWGHQAICIYIQYYRSCDLSFTDGYYFN